MDAQGFNLYHGNRLIKAMWEVYRSPSSVGRGVIGVVEVDFVQPSHDKQVQRARPKEDSSPTASSSHAP